MSTNSGPPSKVGVLSSLTEDELRRNVVLPLLNRMNFFGPLIYHGSREYGKDVICWQFDPLKRRRYLGIVVKAADLSGSVSKGGGVREVLHQCEQCFSIPYNDLFGMSSVTMNEVWIITSGKISQGAADSVFESLRKYNLDKLVTFISGTQLAGLIDEHYPSFWNQGADSPEHARDQCDRVIAFLRRILRAAKCKESEIDSLVGQLIHNNRIPRISEGWASTFFDLSPYEIQIESIKSVYRHHLWSTQCGVLRDQYLEAREKVHYAMRDVEEIFYNYEAVVKKVEPAEYIDEFQKRLGKNYPFWQSHFGSAGDALSQLGWVAMGLQDLEDFVKACGEKGILDWVLLLFDSIAARQRELEDFIKSCNSDSFSIYWSIPAEDSQDGVGLHFSPPSTTGIAVIKCDHKLSIFDGYERMTGKGRSRTVTAKDVIDDGLCQLRMFLDAKLGIDPDK